jgi:hypothetical protein
MIWNFIDMPCLVVKIVPANWKKLISDRFYCIRKSKLKNIVTNFIEIQVQEAEGAGVRL